MFVSERGSPFTTAGFRKLVARLGVAAKFKYAVHPHMLRHACGFKLANDGVDTRALQHYLGHKSIQHTCAIQNCRPTGSRTSGGTDGGRGREIAAGLPPAAEMFEGGQHRRFVPTADTTGLSYCSASMSFNAHVLSKKASVGL